MNDYLGRNVKMKRTNEIGEIIEYNYLESVDHYFFKIKVGDKEIITFNEFDFKFI